MKRKLGALATLLGMMCFVAVPIASADHGERTEQGNCPIEGKVNATDETQEAINGLVLEAGTHVCIKGGREAVLVTADGVKTLQQLLGSGKDVSHYTIIQRVTTTTVPETTTTTVVDSTTTTQPEETTTTTEQVTTTTVVDTTSTTVAPEPEEPEELEELPFTGIDIGTVLGIGFVLIVAGGTALYLSRDV